MLKQFDGLGFGFVNFRFEMNARDPSSSDDEILSGNR